MACSASNPEWIEIHFYQSINDQLLQSFSSSGFKPSPVGPLIIAISEVSGEGSQRGAHRRPLIFHPAGYRNLARISDCRKEREAEKSNKYFTSFNQLFLDIYISIGAISAFFSHRTPGNAFTMLHPCLSLEPYRGMYINNTLHNGIPLRTWLPSFGIISGFGYRQFLPKSSS